jgi:hypothetical protein
MAGIISSDYSVYLIGLESAYGTDKVGADLVANADLTYLAINNGGDIVPVPVDFQPDRARASQDGVASTFIEDMSEINLPVPMKAGVGTANTPNYGPLLKAAGFVETIGASTTTYTLGTSNASSVSVWKYQRNLTNSNWRLKRALGGVLNMALSSAPGEEPVLTFAGMGANYADNTTDRAYFDTSGEPALDASGGSITYTGAATRDSAERLLCVGATITYNSGTVPSSSVSLDAAMVIAAIKTQNADPLSVRITRSRAGVSPANGSVGIETTDDAAAYDDIRAAAAANEIATLSILYQGTTKQVTIATRVQFVGRPSERESNGSMGFDGNFVVVGDFATHPFGDNAFVITYATIA